MPISKCINCNKSTRHFYSKRCKSCYTIFSSGKNNPNWRGGKPKCLDCSKQIGYGYSRCKICSNKSRTGKILKETVRYKYLHKWIRQQLGSPTKCTNCGFESNDHRMIHWANKSGEYMRDFSDWMALCAKCHKNYDNSRR